MKKLTDYHPDDLAEVLDIEVVFPIATPSGRPAKATYTVREHLGDTIENPPGVILIRFAPRDITLADGTVKRLPADSVQVNIIQTCVVSRRHRLEPKERPSIAEVMDPETATLQRIAAGRANA